MTYETWRILFFVFAALTMIFTASSIFFIIKFRFFSLVRFSLRDKKSSENPAVTKPLYTGETEALSVTESIRTDNTEKTSDINKSRSSSDTVIAGTDTSAEGTVLVRNSFRVTKSTVIIHADPSVIDTVIAEHS